MGYNSMFDNLLNLPGGNKNLQVDALMQAITNIANGLQANVSDINAANALKQAPGAEVKVKQGKNGTAHIELKYDTADLERQANAPAPEHSLLGNLAAGGGVQNWARGKGSGLVNLNAVFSSILRGAQNIDATYEEKVQRAKDILNQLRERQAEFNTRTAIENKQMSQKFAEEEKRLDKRIKANQEQLEKRLAAESKNLDKKLAADKSLLDKRLAAMGARGGAGGAGSAGGIKANAALFNAFGQRFDAIEASNATPALKLTQATEAMQDLANLSPDVAKAYSYRLLAMRREATSDMQAKMRKAHNLALIAGGGGGLDQKTIDTLTKEAEANNMSIQVYRNSLLDDLSAAKNAVAKATAQDIYSNPRTLNQVVGFYQKTTGGTVKSLADIKEVELWWEDAVLKAINSISPTTAAFAFNNMLDDPDSIVHMAGIIKNPIGKAKQKKPVGKKKKESYTPPLSSQPFGLL